MTGLPDSTKPGKLLALAGFALPICLPLLAACTGESSSSVPSSRTSASGSSIETPCFNNGCAAVEPLLTIPDAENMIFSDTGRLFVSGGQSVVEVTRSGTDYAAKTVSVANCNFTGLAIARNTLYANCGDGSLWAGSLADSNLRLSEIYRYKAMGLANGLSNGLESNTLYAVDGPVSGSSLPSSKIVRLKLASTNPNKVESDEVWLNLNGSFPNGLQRQGRVLYYTDSSLPNLGRLNAVLIRPDGTAGEPRVVSTLQSLPDDFSLLPDGFAVTYFLTGQVVKLDFLGRQVDGYSPLTFSTGASQVMRGRPPLFSASDLLVTEKGILGEQFSPVGNRLTLVRNTQR